MTLRLPKAELPAELAQSMIKQLGLVPENVEVSWHSPRVTQDNLEFGARVGAWDGVDPGLKSFAHMAVASQVGCSWCLDVGYFQARNANLDLTKASQVPRWREARSSTCPTTRSPQPWARPPPRSGRSPGGPGRTSPLAGHASK